MTQHQAPEVTSVVVPLGIWNAVVDAAQAYADFAAAREAMNAARPAISATYKAYHEAERKHWTTAISLAQVAEQIVAASTDDTRTTQPLSLTVDEGLVEAVARIIDPYVDDDGDSHVAHMAWQIATTKARTILDRLQSLSLPVDIDRSGLAQEVE